MLNQRLFTTAVLALFCAFLLLSALPATAQDGDDQSALFTAPTEEPVIVLEEGHPLAKRYSNPGAMIYHEGQFHMFRNAFSAWPYQTDVSYFTSEDGLAWQPALEQPIMNQDDVEFAEVTIMASSVLVEDDGTWVMYFYTWDTYSAPFGRGSIGRATAATPAGPWTPDPAPILEAGSEDAWDGLQVGVPLVIKAAEDDYRLYYSGFSQEREMRIGLATSKDGITWTKYDNPATSEGLYAASDPILEPSEDGWDSSGVERPRVVQTDEGWLMLYRSPGRTQFGLARSADGITWQKVGDEAAVNPSDFPEGASTFLFTFLHVADTYYLFSEVIPNSSSDSAIYLLTHQGPLLEMAG